MATPIGTPKRVWIFREASGGNSFVMEDLIGGLKRWWRLIYPILSRVSSAPLARFSLEQAGLAHRGLLIRRRLLPVHGEEHAAIGTTFRDNAPPLIPRSALSPLGGPMAPVLRDTRRGHF
jgi:hypothetical protein